MKNYNNIGKTSLDAKHPSCGDLSIISNKYKTNAQLGIMLGCVFLCNKSMVDIKGGNANGRIED